MYLSCVWLDLGLRLDIGILYELNGLYGYTMEYNMEAEYMVQINHTNICFVWTRLACIITNASPSVICHGLSQIYDPLAPLFSHCPRYVGWSSVISWQSVQDISGLMYALSWMIKKRPEKWSYSPTLVKIKIHRNKEISSYNEIFVPVTTKSMSVGKTNVMPFAPWW